MLFDVTRYDGFPVSADFRLYLRAEIKRTRQFDAYRERNPECPTFARMSRDDLIMAVHGCGLDFGELFTHYHRDPPRAVTKKFRAMAAQVELEAARHELAKLGYSWHEKSGKWLKNQKW